MSPEVNITIQPYLYQFIKSSYGINPLLDSKNFLSPIIYSFLEVPSFDSDEGELQKENSPNTINFRLDTCHGINIFKYNYINPERYSQIERMISEYLFWPFFHTYILSYLARDESHGIKDGIFQFIEEYDMVDVMDYETLKKRFYRFRQFFIPKNAPDSPGYQTSLF